MRQLIQLERADGYLFGLVVSLDDAAALDETNQNHDHGGHKKDVNESSHSVRGEESKRPEHDKNDSDCPQHGFILLRSGTVEHA